MYRYWDGHAWSAVTSPNPSAPPPSSGIGQPTDSGAGQQGGPFGTQSTQPTAYQNYQQQSKKKSPIGWWIGAGALAAVIILVVALVVRNVGGGTINNPGGPGGGGSENPCPTSTQQPSAGGNEGGADGRVHGGPISYPRLPEPWSAPQPDHRVPFGSDVQVQQIVIEPGYDGNNSWVASVLVARLMAGDGFFTPEQGSEIVAKCIVGAFYGDNPVDREDKQSKSMKIDGHEAWYLESFLSFDVDGLEANGETMIVVIVNAGETSGLYYASIPNNAEEHLPAARKALQQIKVDG